KARVEIVLDKDYILLPLWTQDPLISSSSKDSPSDGFKLSREEEKKDAKNPGNEDNKVLNEDVGAEAVMTNLDTNIPVIPIPTTRIHKDHPVEQIIGDIHSVPQTKKMTKNVTNYVYQMDVKSVFLYGRIEEEVYVCQPSGFEDPEFLERVYKVEKASYGLHQAPRA
nr:ribonuclease H-like domain-containing protein [Tanacetum cinerariifolium]